MAIQHRRGAYTDFDPSRLKPGEFAIVLSSDTGTSDGKAAYIAFSAGNVKRLATVNDIQADLNEATEEATQRAEEAAASIALTQAQINALVALLT